jgi:tRNA A-37 threonylcarbamoyl transferase component Bud32
MLRFRQVRLCPEHDCSIVLIYTVHGLDDFRVYQAEAFFASKLSDWQAVFDTAQADQQRRMLSGSDPSASNGYRGDMTRTDGTSARFVYQGLLGTGSYGEVTKVKEVTSGQLYAQKFIQIRDRHSPTEKARVEERVKNEVTIMQRLRHHHIASILFYVKATTAFSLIMTPVGDYDLFQFLEYKCRNFPRDEIKHLDNWFGCLISALAFAHDQQIKHEDIKPCNIIIKDHQPYLAEGNALWQGKVARQTTHAVDNIIGRLMNIAHVPKSIRRVFG